MKTSPTRLFSLILTAGLLASVSLPQPAHAGPLEDLLATSVLWLDAADSATLTTEGGGEVSAWANKGGSGAAGNAVQATTGSQPLYGGSVIHGMPAVRFDGMNDHLAGAYVNNSTTMTLYLVAQWQTDVLNRGPLSLITAPGDNDSNSPGRLALLRDDSTKIDAWRGLFNGGTAMRGMPVTELTPYIIELRYDGTFAGSDIIVTRDGFLQPANEKFDWGPPGFTAAFDVNNYVIGGRSEGAVSPWHGDIAELIVFNSALGSADRALVEDYLQTKYAIVPEPSIAALLALGGGLLLLRGRSRGRT